jgi:hypothetical protein
VTLRAPPPPQLMKMKSIISGHKATPVKMNTGLCEVGRNSTPIQRQCFPSQPCPPPATSSLCETRLTRHRHDRFRGQNFINIKGQTWNIACTKKEREGQSLFGLEVHRLGVASSQSTGPRLSGGNTPLPGQIWFETTGTLAYCVSTRKNNSLHLSWECSAVTTSAHWVVKPE